MLCWSLKDPLPHHTAHPCIGTARKHCLSLFLFCWQIILEMPDSVTFAGELQQCLDVCNRNMRAASESAARTLTSVHSDVASRLLQDVKSIRTSLLRATELEEEEVAQRIKSLRARQSQ